MKYLLGVDQALRVDTPLDKQHRNLLRETNPCTATENVTKT